MQFKVTRPDGKADYTDFKDNDDLLHQLKTGQVLSVQVACIFEALPHSVTVGKGYDKFNNPPVSISRVGFCYMLKVYATESKIPAIKWAREILGWGLKDTFDLVNYCLESF